MNFPLRFLSDAELDSIRGGRFQNDGWRGGTLHFSNGNSIHSGPAGIRVDLNDATTNRISNTLNVAGAALLPFQGLGTACYAASGMMNLMNQGHGVTIRNPATTPFAIITPRR
jgi:hypothetical protein